MWAYCSHSRHVQYFIIHFQWLKINVDFRGKSVRWSQTPSPLAYAVYAFINVDNCERPLRRWWIVVWCCGQVCWWRVGVRRLWHGCEWYWHGGVRCCLWMSVWTDSVSLGDIGRVHTAIFTRREYPSRMVRVGLPVYTLRPLRRVRPVHSYHIGRCSQWMRTVRVELVLQCERASAHVCRLTYFVSNTLICNAANRARRNHDTVG